jgi:hypothetical protein
MNGWRKFTFLDSFQCFLEAIKFDRCLFLIYINEFYLKMIKEHTFEHFLPKKFYQKI